jgi:hypothetical protein
MSEIMTNQITEEQWEMWDILAHDGKPVWSGTVVEDPDNPEEYMLVFPEGLLERVGWVPGDNLSWEELPNGDFRLGKI